MTETKPLLCRLCLKSCEGHLEYLCDGYGQHNEKYSITIEYFDSMLFQVDDHLKVLCMDCWHHIEEFHTFQKAVLESRSKLEELQHGYTAGIPVKVEAEESYHNGDDQWTNVGGDVKGMEDEEEGCGAIVKEEVDYHYPDTLKDNDVFNYSSYTIKDLNPCNSELKDTTKTAWENKSFNQLFHTTERDKQTAGKLGGTTEASSSAFSKITPTKKPRLQGNDKNPVSKIKKEKKNLEHTLSPESLDLSAFVKVPQKRPLKSKREEELDNIIAQWKSQLACMNCPESFATYTLLHEHFKECHSNEEFFIQCCDLKIKKRGHLVEHIRMHIDYKAFKCSICARRFNRKRNLQAHLQRMHNINDLENLSFSDVGPAMDTFGYCETIEDNDQFIAQYLPNIECVVCKDTFATFTLLVEHFRQQHSNEECHILCCGFKLNQQSTVVQHLKAHTHPRKYKCELCNACFTMQHTLDYHMRMEHQNTQNGGGIIYSDAIAIEDNSLAEINMDKFTIQESDDFIAQWLPSLECELCREPFTTFTLLHNHFRDAHPSEKLSIRCCDKAFFTRSKIQRHLCVHLQNKAFKCQLCGKRYSKKATIQTHMLKQHYGNIPKANTNHNATTTSQENNTPNKRKSIKELDEIIARWRPTLECLECREECSSFSLLQTHFRQQHPAQVCYILCCDCKFVGRHDIEEHIRYHNDPDVFKCPHCDRRFARKRDSMRHMKTCAGSGSLQPKQENP
ncbi:zinc finger protein 845-like [Musca vetustissima]|uniref:zinc finger protein 845-like n=1 Tax=Musca vetustissima TaxID=27455 RepID=UPI002AB67C6D|nr:zinc finger protein 845-like [Musca vetustissima]